MKITGKLLTVGVPTAKGRIYPRDVVERAVAEVQSQIEEHRLLVAVGDVNPAEISPDYVAGFVKILELWENGDLIVEAETLDTSKGRRVAEMVENAEVSTSILGLGLVGDGMQVTDLHITAIGVEFNNPNQEDDDGTDT